MILGNTYNGGGVILFCPKLKKNVLKCSYYLIRFKHFWRKNLLDVNMAGHTPDTQAL